MKRFASIICMVWLTTITASAQTVYCALYYETCPDDFPPDADVVLEGSPVSFWKTDILEHDADWFFYDDSSSAWFALDDSQILVYASGTFDSEFTSGEWQTYLEDVDTAFTFAADGDLILVMSKSYFHALDIPSSYMLSIPSEEDIYVTSCTTPDGDRIDWFRNTREGFQVVRCYRRFRLGRHQAQLKVLENPHIFKEVALQVLNATSPHDLEKQRYDIEHHLNPPELWYNERGQYAPMYQIYILLDGDYADDLETGDFGPQNFWSVSLHDRVVKLNRDTLDFREFGDVALRKRRARNALLNIFERALLSATGKWLLWIETGDDNNLIRDLTAMFTRPAS